MNTNFDILKEKFKNVYFITGLAYAGKSTMVKRLTEKHGGIACEENWHDFVRRRPDEYAQWIKDVSLECEKIELMMLPDIADQGKPVFVDTNIAPETLHRISDSDHVLIMLAPIDISVKRFFVRPDREKQFLYRLMLEEADPQAALDNFRKCLEKINSQENYDYYKNCGFPVIYCDENRTIEQTLALVEKSFKLDK